MTSTGLTFGTISALNGLSHGIVSRQLYFFLVATVPASAVIPTHVASSAFVTAASAAASDDVVLQP